MMNPDDKLFQRLKYIKKCYWCGNKASNGVGDHLPPKSLMRDIKTKCRLMSVPACASCNNGFSNNDTDIIAALSMTANAFTSEVPNEATAPYKRIFGTTNGAPGNNATLRKFLRALKRVNIIDQYGVFLQHAYGIGGNELSDAFMLYSKRLAKASWMVLTKECMPVDMIVQGVFLQDGPIDHIDKIDIITNLVATALIPNQPNVTWARRFYSHDTYYFSTIVQEGNQQTGLTVLCFYRNYIIVFFGHLKYSDTTNESV